MPGVIFSVVLVVMLGSDTSEPRFCATAAMSAGHLDDKGVPDNKHASKSNTVFCAYGTTKENVAFSIALPGGKVLRSPALKDAANGTGELVATEPSGLQFLMKVSEGLARFCVNDLANSSFMCGVSDSAKNPEAVKAARESSPVVPQSQPPPQAPVAPTRSPSPSDDALRP